MDWSIVISWLLTDAGAGWIFGSLGLIYFVVNKIDDYSKKEKPNIIICKEIDKFTLVKIYKKVKENTTVVYKGNQIKNLAQIELELYNSGNEIIKNIKINISFNKGTEILDVITVKTNDVQGTRYTDKSADKNEMTISLPYLNPYKEYKSKLLLNIVCDGNIDYFEVSGGGIGWTLIHKKILTYEQTTARLYVFTTILFIETLFSTFLGKSNYIKVGSFIKIDYFSILFFLTYSIGTYWVINNSSILYRLRDKLDTILKNMSKIVKNDRS